MIRVLLADDHAVVRTGLSMLIDSDAGMEVVGAATNGAEAVQLAGEHRPDVILMDLSMPGMDGIEATGHVARVAPDAAVVMLTSFSDRDKIMLALDAGAIGYLLKDTEPDEMLAGIRTAAAGESPLSPKAATALLQARTTRRPDAGLSERERDVLELVAEGLPNKLIARRLEITEKTVKTHLTSIFRQIGVDDRTQAALWAHRNGIKR